MSNQTNNNKQRPKLSLFVDMKPKRMEKLWDSFVLKFFITMFIALILLQLISYLWRSYNG